jgi:hypothetical protein
LGLLDGQVIELLKKEPPTWPNGGRHSTDCGPRVLNQIKQEARMNQVESGTQVR